MNSNHLIDQELKEKSEQSTTNRGVLFSRTSVFHSQYDKLQNIKNKVKSIVKKNKTDNLTHLLKTWTPLLMYTSFIGILFYFILQRYSYREKTEAEAHCPHFDFAESNVTINNFPYLSSKCERRYLFKWYSANNFEYYSEYFLWYSAIAAIGISLNFFIQNCYPKFEKPSVTLVAEASELLAIALDQIPVNRAELLLKNKLEDIKYTLNTDPQRVFSFFAEAKEANANEVLYENNLKRLILEYLGLPELADDLVLERETKTSIIESSLRKRL